MNEPHSEKACPLGSVHRRMEDAHRLWHHALDSYFDPDGFRVPLQSCIQQLRSVTWLLQNQKDKIPSFEAWYGEWQDRMRADPLMRWLVSARNRIEKQGDLESHSSVRAQIIASYFNEIPEVEVEARLYDTLKSILARIHQEAVDKQVLEHGTLRVERRWVANDLPDREMLDALSEIYGKLSELVDDAHRQLGLPVPTTLVVHGKEWSPAPGGGPAGGRLPCMVAAGHRRSTYISLKSGNVVGFDAHTKTMTANEVAAIEKQYGPIEDLKAANEVRSLRDLANWYFGMARKIFLNDGYHSSMAFLIQRCRPIRHMELPFKDRSDKYLLMRLLADEVERCNADAVMLVGEHWSAKVDLTQPYLYASDVPNRTEHLAINVCAADGENFSLSAQILRDDNTVRLADTTEVLRDQMNIFAPIRAVWQKARMTRP